MPRHDWHDDDFMTRERSDRGYRDFAERDRDYGDFENRDRGALFGGDRGELSMRRRRAGGWGSLLNDESSGGRARSHGDRSEYRRERSFGPDDYRTGIPTDETARFIASNKVEGTPVYDRDGERLGSIHNFMVDKFSGRVLYAVLKHSSGFLGLDERYYPLDWDQLRYDERLGGYHIGMNEDELKRFGSWDRNERWRAMRSERDRFDRERFDRGRREHDYRPDFERGAMREFW